MQSRGWGHQDCGASAIPVLISYAKKVPPLNPFWLLSRSGELNATK